MARIGLAELALSQGQSELAVDSARRALEAAERTGPALLVWRARRRLGAALTTAGRRDEGEEQFRLASDAARAAGAYPELARCLGDWLRVRALFTDLRDAESQALEVEMREVLNYLAGSGPRPPGHAPVPDAPTVAPGPQPAPAGSATRET